MVALLDMPLPIDLEKHRPALTGHCYRMLGSAVDADDAVQETMLRAWRSADRFEGRASVQTWLYRIATNVCLDALRTRNRRERPLDVAPAGTVHDPLGSSPHERWLEPIPDGAVLPAELDPSARAVLRESVRLAFVAALQHLPPKQRAVLLLTQVLGWSAAEAAESLNSTVASVNSALQRARSTLHAKGESRHDPQIDADQAELLERYVDAFERYDMDALTALLHEDATLSMPPHSLWLRGHASIRDWMLGRGYGCEGSKLVATNANAAPAFGQYRRGEAPGTYTPWSLIVLDVHGGRISSMTHFLDTETLFPRFELPAQLSERETVKRPRATDGLPAHR